jgi:hypothetical protein
LGSQIALCALVFFFGFWVVIGGLNGVGQALELVLDRRKVYGWLVFAWVALAATGAVLSSGVVMYWIERCG